MLNKVHVIIYGLTSGLFLLLDQILKYWARTNPETTYYLWQPWLGWEYLANSGVAFSLPIPNFIMVLLTPLILLAIFIFLYKKINKTNIFFLTIFLIIAGAISNYIDRVLFSVTIDYLRILTGVINLADVMIVGGVGLLIFKEYIKNHS